MARAGSPTSPDTLAPVPAPPSPEVAASQGETLLAAGGSGMPPAASGAFVYRVLIAVPHSLAIPGPLLTVPAERLYTPAEIAVVRKIYDAQRPGAEHVKILEEIPVEAAPAPVPQGRALYVDLMARYNTQAGRNAVARVFPHSEVGNFEAPKRVLL